MKRLTERNGKNGLYVKGLIEFEAPKRALEKLVEVVERLAAYEDTGMEPAICAEYKKFEDELLNSGKSIHHVIDLLSAEIGGRLVVLDEKAALAMCAGARAIENNKRLWGATYAWDIFGQFGDTKELSYYEAAKVLRDAAETALERMTENAE